MKRTYKNNLFVSNTLQNGGERTKWDGQGTLTSAVA